MTTTKTLQSRRSKLHRDHQAITDEITRLQLWGEEGTTPQVKADIKALKASARKAHAEIARLDAEITASIDADVNAVAESKMVRRKTVNDRVPAEKAPTGDRRVAVTCLVTFDQLERFDALMVEHSFEILNIEVLVKRGEE